MNVGLFVGGPQAMTVLTSVINEGHDVAYLAINPGEDNTELIAAARRNDVPVLQRDVRDINRYRCLRCDFGLSVGSKTIFPDSFRRLFTTALVNIHPSLLPKYRGLHAVKHAIKNGDRITGLTAHLIDSHIDGGPIISQVKVSIDWTDSCEDVEEKLRRALPLMISQLLTLDQTRLAGTPQDERSATRVHKIKGSDLVIDFTWSSIKIYNHIRALASPGYGARTDYSGTEIAVWRASYDPSWPRVVCDAGVVLATVPGLGAYVSTDDSGILICDVSSLGSGSALVPRPDEWVVGVRLSSSPDRGVSLDGRTAE